MKNKIIYMQEALKQANRAFNKNEVPIGVVIVYKNQIIAKSYNKKEKNNNCLEHAEIRALKKAFKKQKNWRLNECELFTTLEPCPMCASAIQQARIKKVYIGASKQTADNRIIINQIFNSNDSNAKQEVEYGILKDECTTILTKFFKNKRK